MIRGSSSVVFDGAGCACGFVALLLANVCLAQSAAPTTEALLQLLSEEAPASLREAAEAIQKQVPQDREQLIAVSDAVKAALSSTRDASAQRSLRLALGKLAAAGVEDAAEWGFESMSVTHNAKTPPKVFEAHARALEMVPGAAKELMIGNLDVALNFPDADPKERQRLKEFVTLTAEALKTRELAVFLDALLTGEEDLFVKIEAPIEIRLIACYQLVKAEPPVTADAVVQWLEKHPGGPPEVEIAALETISLVGTTDPDAATKLASRLLEKPSNTLTIARRLIAGRISKKLKPQIETALRSLATENDEAKKLLTDLSQLPN